MRASGRTAAAWLAAAGAAALLACAGRPPAVDEDVYRRASATRVEHLEREVARLRADLHEAEETLVRIESDLRGEHGRADAVSAVAEARVALESARARAPWRRAECDEALSRLEEAEAHLQAGRLATAIFFASRAQRIAANALAEARRVQAEGRVLYVRSRANLREGPGTPYAVVDTLSESTPLFEERVEGEWILVRTHAGRVGWIHAPLVDLRGGTAATRQSLPPALAR